MDVKGEVNIPIRECTEVQYYCCVVSSDTDLLGRQVIFPCLKHVLVCMSVPELCIIPLLKKR